MKTFYTAHRQPPEQQGSRWPGRLLPFLCLLCLYGVWLPANAQPNIIRLEYYIDTDPGFGNATALSFTPAADLANLNIALDPATVSEGVHRLFVRAQDASGKWSLTNTWLFYKPYGTTGGIPPLTPPSNIIRIEYYLDNDPGFGSATAMSISPGTDIQDAIIAVNPATVSEGVHRLFVRALNANGAWSLTNTWLFYKPYGDGGTVPVLQPPTNITLMEYYIDNDPGFGSGTPVSITPGTDLADIVVSINPATLMEGVHRFNVRARNANGVWSLTNTWLFYKPYPSTAAPAIAKMKKLEYYIDTDPGYGSGVPVALDSLTDFSDYVMPINVTGLSVGTHNLWVRGQDKDGKWSMMNKWLFSVSSAIATPSIVVNSVTRKIGCARDSFDVSYDRTGTYNTGNLFKVELSDASGSFATPVVIGSYTGTDNTIIRAALPAHLPDGNNYHVRVSSTNPAVSGIAGKDSLTIHDRPFAQAITGLTQVNGTFTQPYTVSTTTGSNWNWLVNGGTQSSGGTTNSVNVTWAQPATPSINGKINVIETNQYGCVGDTSSLSLTIYKLRIGNMIASSACKGFGLNVSINADGAYYTSNTYTAQLSDAIGNFAAPINIGSAALVGNGVGQTATINAIVPAGIPNGIGYKIRIVSSNPAFTGDTSAAISIIKPDVGTDITRSKCHGFSYDLRQNYTDASLTYVYYTQAFGTLSRPDSVDAGTYQVIATNSIGCKDTATITVTNYTKPDIGPDKTVTISCPGSTYDLTTVFVTAGLTTTWSIATPNVATAGVYQLIVTNTNGCKDTANVTVTNAPLTTVATIANTKIANRECTTADGWTHYYYDNNTPADYSDDIRLLSLKKNGQNIGSIGDGTFQVKVAATTGAGSSTAVQVSSPLITNPYWSMNRYWAVAPTQQPTSGNVGVRFYYNTQDLTDVNGSYPNGPIAHNQLVLYKTDGNPDPTSNFAGATLVKSYLNGATPSTTNWVYTGLGNNIHQAEFEVTSFSGGGAGATQNGGTLPISLLRFIVSGKNSKALLSWSTVTESNSRNFLVERSLDGINYSTVGSVIAAGQSTSQRNYSFTDDVSSVIYQPTTVYYRLQLVDLNNDRKASPVVSIKLGESKTGLSLLYNPVQSEAVVQYKSMAAQKVTLQVIDASGKRVLIKNETAIAGTNQYRIGTAMLAKGIYTVQLINSNGEMFTLKMMKE